LVSLAIILAVERGRRDRLQADYDTGTMAVAEGGSAEAKNHIRGARDRASNMDLSDAIHAVREMLVEHRVSRTADLWSTILNQIAEQDSFDGRHADTILDLIRSYLARLDDQTTIDLWRTTEAGSAGDSEDDCLFPDSIRMDLEMELLKGVTDLAWDEATGRS
jgi:hypothetical protein